MRTILRDTCVFAALMILTVFSFSIIWSGVTAEILLVLELFGLALFISVINYVFDEITTMSIIGGYVVKFFLISLIVMLFGLLIGWFFLSNFWMAFIYVGTIMVLKFALDTVQTERDIDEINSMVKQKRESREAQPFTSKRGWKMTLCLMIVMGLISGGSLIAVKLFGDHSANESDNQRNEAQKAGYTEQLSSYSRETDILIDGIRYDCYSKDSDYVYIKEGSYIDNSEGKSEGLDIYCKNGSFNNIVDAYSVTYQSSSMPGGMAITLVTGCAALFLAIVLVIYTIVYRLSKRTSC